VDPRKEKGGKERIAGRDGKRMDTTIFETWLPYHKTLVLGSRLSLFCVMTPVGYEKGRPRKKEMIGQYS